MLTWGDDGGVCAAVHESYVELLGERMGQLLGLLDAIAPDAASPLLRELGELPDESFFRFLTAPETSWRLLWPRQHRPEEAARFLLGAVAAERASARSRRSNRGAGVGRRSAIGAAR